MTSFEDRQENSTNSSSSINFRIFSDKINTFYINEAPSFNNINLDLNNDKSEYPWTFNKNVFLSNSSNFNHEPFLTSNSISSEESQNLYNLNLINSRNNQKEKKFKTTIVLKRKRGRKEGEMHYNKKPSLKNKNNNKIIIHDNTTLDNLQRKINVHFLSFLINISNDALKNEIKGQNFNFKPIDYKIKQKIDEIFFKKIKTLSLKEILEMDISPKFSNYKKDENKNTLNNICKLSNNWLNNFFNMTYLDLLDYYYTDQKINKIKIHGKEIFFSEKTKSFYDLLNTKKNEYIKEQLKDVLFRVFFYESPKCKNNGQKFNTIKK